MMSSKINRRRYQDIKLKCLMQKTSDTIRSFRQNSVKNSAIFMKRVVSHRLSKSSSTSSLSSVKSTRSRTNRHTRQRVWKCFQCQIRTHQLSSMVVLWKILMRPFKRLPTSNNQMSKALTTLSLPLIHSALISLLAQKTLVSTLSHKYTTEIMNTSYNISATWMIQIMTVNGSMTTWHRSSFMRTHSSLSRKIRLNSMSSKRTNMLISITTWQMITNLCWFIQTTQTCVKRTKSFSNLLRSIVIS